MRAHEDAKFDYAPKKVEEDQTTSGDQQQAIAPPECSRDLQTMTFAPIKHIVPGILIEGLTLFAGKPKAGKSWLLLDVAAAVATNGFTLGELHCMPGDVLYCALEDSKRRLQSRLRKLPFGFPERLFYFVEMSKLADGGLDQIRAWITTRPEARLVIIDTLAMVRESKKREDTNYEADYKAVLELRKLANELKIAIVIVHHLRKADADDAFDTVSGTLGLTGAPDSILILKHEGGANYSLHGKGRDLSDFQKAITFDRESCRWRITGEAAEVKRSTERSAVLAAIQGASEPVGPRDIADETGMKEPNIRKLLGKLVKEGAIAKVKRGLYCSPVKCDHNGHNAPL
jgi:RecA-family ATPase